MQKLLLVSILVVTIAVPAAAARAATPALGLRRVVWWMLAAMAGYALAIMFVFPHLVS